MAHAEVHVFGSISGYGTVAASRGLRDDERKELESFQFGEAATKEVIQALEHRATMTGRPLRSGRYAISRMIPAGTDDAGRPTIEIVSIVLDPAGFEACAGALEVLAGDFTFWRSARASAAAGVNVPSASPTGAPADPAVHRVFDVWMAAVRARAIGVFPESEAVAILRFVCSLHPADRAQCRWGVGIMSISAPVDICSTVSGTSTIGARTVVKPAPPGRFHLATEMDYVQFRAPHAGRSLPQVEEIGLNTRELVLADEPGSPVVRAAAVSAAPAWPARAPSSDRRPMSPLARVSAGSAVLSTIVLVLALSAYNSRPKVAESVAESAPMQPGEAHEIDSHDGVGVAPPEWMKGSSPPEGAVDPIPSDGPTPASPPSPAPPSPPAEPPPAEPPPAAPPPAAPPPAAPPPAAPPPGAPVATEPAPSTPGGGSKPSVLPPQAPPPAIGTGEPGGIEGNKSRAGEPPNIVSQTISGGEMTRTVRAIRAEGSNLTKLLDSLEGRGPRIDERTLEATISLSLLTIAELDSEQPVPAANVHDTSESFIPQGAELPSEAQPALRAFIDYLQTLSSLYDKWKEKSLRDARTWSELKDDLDALIHDRKKRRDPSYGAAMWKRLDLMKPDAIKKLLQDCKDSVPARQDEEGESS